MAETRLKVIIDVATGAANAALSGFGSALSTTVKAGALGIAATATAMGGLAVSAFKTGAEFNTLNQRANAAFTTILGSADAAATMMADITAFAKTSPFPRQAFITASQQMLAFGVESKKVIPYLAAIQDAVAAAGGGAQQIQDVASILADVTSAGKITAGTLNQLGARGIDAAQLIGSQMGKTGLEIKEMITKGTLGAAEALDALAAGMESRFGGAAENVKETWVGAVDRIKGAFRDLGAILAAPFIAATGGGMAVVWANQVADAMRALGPIVKAVMDAVMTALGPSLGNIGTILASITEGLKGVDVSGLVSGLAAMAPVLGAIVGAAVAFSGTFLTNIPVVGELLGTLAGPIGILVTALAGLVASSPDLQALFGSVFQKALDALAPALAVVMDSLAQLSPILTDVVSAFAPLVVVLAGALAPVLSAIAPVIVAFAAILADLAPAVANALVPAIEAIGSGLAVLAPVFGSILAAVAPLLPVIAGVFGQLIAAAVPIIVRLVSAIAPLVTILADALGPILGVIGDLFATMLPVIAPLITILAGALAPILGFVAELFAAILPIVAELISGILPPLVEVLSAVFLAITPLIAPLGDLIIQLVTLALKAFLPLLPVILDLVKVLLPVIPPVVRITELTLKLIEAFMPLIEAVVGVVSVIEGKFATVLVRILEKVLMPWVDILEDWADGLLLIIDAVENLIDWLSKLKPPKFLADLGGMLGIGGNAITATVTARTSTMAAVTAPTPAARTTAGQTVQVVVNAPFGGGEAIGRAIRAELTNLDRRRAGVIIGGANPRAVFG